jgi:hypothetical protein
MALKAWENFYVIAGSAGAALIGLQFVVMALLADMELPRSSGGVDAFATPTIVHFGTVLLVSGVATAPWPSLSVPALLLALIGGVGVCYAVLVALRARRQRDYTPVFEDWAFHVLLPGAAYFGFAIAAMRLRRTPADALFIVAAAVFLLLFVGIHNAWDTVRYFVVERQDLNARTSGDADDARGDRRS